MEEAQPVCFRFLTALKQCSSPLDIVFVLDSSASIGEPSHKKMKNFVKAVSDSFIIGPGKAFTAVIQYGTTATTAIRFTDYMNNADFNMAVDALPYLQGETRMDKALQLASSELLTERSGARAGVAKVLVFLTDGRQSGAPDGVDLQKVAMPLLSAGVRVFAVGIGNQIDDNELKLIVDKTDDLIMVPSFDGLATRVRQLSIATCESSGMQLGCCNI